MAAATPTTVEWESVAPTLGTGTDRRLVDIYVEVSPAASATTNLATYVPNLSRVTSVRSHNTATTVISQANTVSLSAASATVTWGSITGVQFAEFRGYLT